MAELAYFVPKSIQLVGLDIDLSQAPPKEWLPSNVELRKWDVLSEVPEELFESFDIVVARDLVLLVEDNDPRLLLLNLLKLLSAYNLPDVRQRKSHGRTSRSPVNRLTCVLEPGGHLQWGEWNAAETHIKRTDDTKSSIGMQDAWSEHLVFRNMTSHPK